MNTHDAIWKSLWFCNLGKMKYMFDDIGFDFCFCFCFFLLSPIDQFYPAMPFINMDFHNKPLSLKSKKGKLVILGYEIRVYHNILYCICAWIPVLSQVNGIVICTVNCQKTDQILISLAYTLCSLTSYGGLNEKCLPLAPVFDHFILTW